MKINKLFLLLTILLSCHFSGKTQYLNWASSFGSIYTDIGLGVKSDANGNVYTTGYFNGTADLNPGTGIQNATSNGDDDIFISKTGVSGSFIWAKSLGSVDYDRGVSVEVDATGNVYILGFFENTMDFDPGAGTANLSPSGGEDVFLLKLNASGNFQWVKRFGLSGLMIPTSVNFDPSGNIIISGSFNQTIDCDPGTGATLLTSTSSYDVFVIKLNPSGNFIWAKSYGDLANCRAGKSCVDRSGNIYTTGYFFTTVDFDPGPGNFNMTAAGGLDAFIVKLDANGNFGWAKQIAGAEDIIGFDITTDQTGNIYSTGSFEQTADFDPGAGTLNLTSSFLPGFYVQKLNSSGNLAWAHGFSNTNTSEGRSIRIDSLYHVIITGNYNGIQDFNPGPGTATLPGTGGKNIFIQTLDSAGNFIWAGAFSGANADVPQAIDIGPSNEILITGSFMDSCDFDPQGGQYFLRSTNLTTEDVFYAKLRICVNSYDTISASACFSYTVPSGSYFVLNSGVYSDVIPNASYCDSLLTINVTINTVDATVSPNGNSLTANATGANYQWLDCGNNFAILPGETLQTFSPVLSGNYAVAVTQNGCTDTSACSLVTELQQENSLRKFRIFPNPASEEFTIEAPGNHSLLQFSISDLRGKLLFCQQLPSTQFHVIRPSLPDGIYFASIRSENEEGVITRFVIQK